MIKVRMLSPDGSSMLRDELHTLYATDMNYVPFRRKNEVNNDGDISVYAPEYPVILNAKIVIPGFGYMWVQADNCGQGYKDGADIEFVREAAVSRVHEVECELKKGEFIPSPECRSKLDNAKTLLKMAETSSKAPDLNMTALSVALWAGELAVVERARTKIAAMKLRENFLFGSAGGFSRYTKDPTSFYPFKENPMFKEMFDSVFNMAILPFYLIDVEPERGKPYYDIIDNLLDAYTASGITPKAHPLWWAHGDDWPKWIRDMKWEDGSVEKELHRIVKRHAERYKGRIKIYEVINEAHDWCNIWNMTQDAQVDMTKMCCDDVHEVEPDAKTLINTCFMFGENVADGKVQWGIVNERNLTPYTYLQKCEEKGIQYELLGMQLYLPSRDMMALDKLFDRFKVFNKPIHITELGVPSCHKDVRLSTHEGGLYCLRYMYNGTWREFNWNERLQADWLESFCTLAYSRLEIESLAWWKLTDISSYIPGAGLLTEEGKPKEAYFRLKALQESWGFHFGQK